MYSFLIRDLKILAVFVYLYRSFSLIDFRTNENLIENKDSIE